MLRSILPGGLAFLFMASVIALPGALNGQDKPASAQSPKEKQLAPKDGQATKSQEKPMGGQAASPAQQRQGRAGGMMGGSQGQGAMMMCPCMKMMMGGGGMMGPAMGKGMMQRGMMMGRNMMGRGGMMGGQSSQAATTAQPRSTPLTKDQAKEEAEKHLKSVGNPNLKIGKVETTRGTYEVQVVTKENSEVNWIIIDKQTGQLRTLY